MYWFYLHTMFQDFQKEMLFLDWEISLIAENFIAYWPIVISLTEHSLSSCIGTCPSNCWYLSIFFFCIRINILCILVMVYSVGINLQKYNIIIEHWSNFFQNFFTFFFITSFCIFSSFGSSKLFVLSFLSLFLVYFKVLLPSLYRICIFHLFVYFQKNVLPYLYFSSTFKTKPVF